MESGHCSLQESNQKKNYAHILVSIFEQGEFITMNLSSLRVQAAGITSPKFLVELVFHQEMLYPMKPFSVTLKLSRRLCFVRGR